MRGPGPPETLITSPVPVVEGPPLPRHREIIARVAVSLATAVVAPAVLLGATLAMFDVAVAVLVALAWMLGVMGWRRATGRPVSGLLVLSVGTLTIKTAFTLATGSTFVYFVQPVFADLIVATVFLGSLATSRPVVAHVAPDFFPMNADVAARPEVCSLFRRLTLMWGLVILAKGCITLWLLQTLSTMDFVLIKGGAVITLTLTAAAVTVVWSTVIGRRQGLIEQRITGTRRPGA